MSAAMGVDQNTHLKVLNKEKEVTETAVFLIF